MTFQQAHPGRPRPPTTDERRPAAVIPIRSTRSSREAAAYRASVRAISCPVCPAGPGQRCTNRQTGAPFMEAVPGHVARARAAERTP